jgi:hypothetical protein
MYVHRRRRTMLRKLLGIGVVCLAVAVLLAGDLALVAPAQVSAAPAVQGTQPAGQYMWNYSVKFVCGFQPPTVPVLGQTPYEPAVKPGNYATEINIHNYTYRDVKVGKKLLILVKDGSPEGAMNAREPGQVEPVVYDKITLKPDGATLDDCYRIWQLAKTPATPNMTAPPLTIGYLVILSPVDLDIDAVYTAQTNVVLISGVPAQPVGAAIDVERIQGKRVFVPAAELAKYK